MQKDLDEEKKLRLATLKNYEAKMVEANDFRKQLEMSKQSIEDQKKSGEVNSTQIENFKVFPSINHFFSSMPFSLVRNWSRKLLRSRKTWRRL
jgi:hypothetical protein